MSNKEEVLVRKSEDTQESMLVLYKYMKDSHDDLGSFPHNFRDKNQKWKVKSIGEQILVQCKERILW